MANLKLSLGGAAHEQVRPLFEGTVQPDGIDLVVTQLSPPETMRRQVRFGEFHISEMALAGYLVARERGAPDMVAIPVFPIRSVFHTQLYYHVDSDISGPGDLAARRIGIAEYVQSAATWWRGVLQHDFGVPLSSVEWYLERNDEESLGAALGFRLPPGMSCERVPSGHTLASMLRDHQLDAAPAGRPALSAGSAEDWSKVKPLFPDPVAERERFLQRYGYIPANHTCVVRGDVLREHPWVARSLYQAFAAARAPLDQLRALEKAVGDPFAYGVAANRPMLQAFVEYACDQGLIAQKPRIEDLFAPQTLDL